MSKGFKITLVVIFTPIIILVTIIGLISSIFSDPVDYFIAKTIPIYPHSQNVEISASSGFPDGSPGADIIFDTDNNQEQLLNFYSPNLKSQGWEEKVKYYHEGELGIGNNRVLDGTKTMEAIYTKKILNVPFTLSFTKTDLTDEQKYRVYSKKVFKNSDAEVDKAIKDQQRVIIFIDRINRS